MNPINPKNLLHLPAEVAPTAIILAAGEGKRMKSQLPKVLHLLGGVPILFYPLNLAERNAFQKIIVVVGHKAEQVEKVLAGRDISQGTVSSQGSPQTVLQPHRLGTGDAVLRAEPLLKDSTGPVFILNGDTPLILPETLTALWETHLKEKATITFLTADMPNPKGYGRVIRRQDGSVSGIVEEKDATDEERKIQEINSGTYIVAPQFLFDALHKISPENAQKEYYLTDIIKIARDSGERVFAFKADAEEVLGINSRADLAQAEAIIQKRIGQNFLTAGVTLIDPCRIRIEANVTIGADTILHPGVTLEGNTKIGERCVLHACRIKDSQLESDVLIKDQSVIEEAIIESNVTVGPFAHIRPGTILRKGAKVGNFVEIKKSELGEGSKANHLTYLGDATIGQRVNIGAGTITCNYDGKKKHKTVIEDDVFVGSDTQFIAPVTIGARSLIAAGSTITKDVEPDALAVSRGKQVTKVGWAKRR
jgi:bifunctional UDP-N-acetylglucosamine pyrophosphorylase/glucosamine-1-phosphate N-acetyltransferase